MVTIATMVVFGPKSRNWESDSALGTIKFVDDNVGLFAEFAAPVLESLDLSAAVRWDDYNHL